MLHRAIKEADQKEVKELSEVIIIYLIDLSRQSQISSKQEELWETHKA